MRKLTFLILVAAMSITLVLPASAQSYPGTTSTTTTTTVGPAVLGETLTRQPTVLGATQTRDEGTLPRTGAAITQWALIGGLLLAVGTALVVRNRRSDRPATEL